MKIHELRFKNLNSLYGDWVIDFQDPEFLVHGIFAITGPTGAGKSTILDALSLALYGRTPRLETVNKTGGNEILSRHTAECGAEVLFETQEGLYRASWKQRRSRGNAAGKLQDYTHTVSDGEGTILEDKKKNVAAYIEQCTGLDFKRFTRSILLAQGDFAAFLKSTSDDRSVILEQITGTDLYSDISKEVHRRRSVERSSLEDLESNTKHISILSTEAESELQAQCKNAQELADKEKIREQEVIEEIQRCTEVAQLLKNFEEQKGLREKNSVETERFSSQEKKIERAEKAQEYEGLYSTLQARRIQLQRDEKEKVRLELDLPNLKEQGAQSELAFAEAQHAQSVFVAKAKDMRGLIVEVTALDRLLHERTEAVKSRDNELQQHQKKQAEQMVRQKEVQQERRLQVEELEKVQIYLAEHPDDGVLSSELAVIDLLMNRMREGSQKIAAQKERLASQERNTEQQAEYHEQLNQSLNRAENKVSECGDQVGYVIEQRVRQLAGKELEEYGRELQHLSELKQFQLQVVHLEDERRKLEDGKECPLCGAQEHPWALGNVPEPSVTEVMITSVQERMTVIQQLNTKEQELKVSESRLILEVQKCQSELSQFEMTIKNHQESLKGMSDEVDELVGIQDKGCRELGVLIDKYGYSDIDVSSIDEIKKELMDRRRFWDAGQVKERQVQNRLVQLNADLQGCDTQAAQLAQGCVDKEMLVEAATVGLQEVQSQRVEIFGSKVCLEEERLLRTEEKKLDLLLEQARQKRDGAARLSNEVEVRLNSNAQLISEHQLLIAQQSEQLIQAIQLLGIDSEEQFVSIRIAPDTLRELKSQGKALNDERVRIHSVIEELEASIKNKQARCNSEMTLEMLTGERAQRAESIAALQKQVGEAQNKLSVNEEQKALLAGGADAIAAQKRECDRWNTLHLYIGSNDGKKYRDFAQGLTFEVMIGHANTQLQNMSDRYLLVRDAEKPLELNVIDAHQGCVERSTKNLSGGESFIVSLALALGLSKMASKRVRIDSLFLDEGFGTLDEDSLEVALNALSGLHEEGKLIGVISHVPALKARIETQIVVTSIEGGKSVLDGPGCSIVA
ncbi:MAG: AAA family ATPase [Fibrobacterales bacterium]